MPLRQRLTEIDRLKLVTGVRLVAAPHLADGALEGFNARTLKVCNGLYRWLLFAEPITEATQRNAVTADGPRRAHGS